MSKVDTMYLVSETTAKAWCCDRCGYVWLKVAGRNPLRCPGCRSRKWNGKQSCPVQQPAPSQPQSTNWDAVYAAARLSAK